ncbi:creatininase family protein [Emcibacter sp.]|uniref:creatininase family protein n=1 Tax=Emcibacter sp. TaxID=1979954 RepID=UPI003B636D5C
MKLALSTWVEVESYLAENKGIIIPIGSTEQHGPTGLMGTDFIIANAIAEACAERIGCYVAPPLAVGMAQHHMAFSGSMTLRPSTYIQVLVDWITSLSKHGFRRIYFINGHGGNIAPTLSAFNEFYAGVSMRPETETSETLCALVNWWMMPKTDAMIREIFAEKDGAHATASEIAITQYLCPESIKPAAPDLFVAAEGSPLDIHNGYDYRRRFKDGRIGSDVRAANPEDGGRVFEQAVKDITGHCKEFFQS